MICINAHIIKWLMQKTRAGQEQLAMREMVKAFKALSDETRLRILNLLLERECCVCEVIQALVISQTRASRNLSILYEAGFLRLRKEGLWSLYSIDRQGMKEHFSDLVEAVRKGLEDNEMAALDIERLKKARRIGVCHAAQMAA
jgi:ArsR family transcriptional regulator